MTLEDTIRQKLMKTLTPESLVITNQSHLHQGHSGSPHTGESHFKIEVVSLAFAGLTRIQRHQKIYEILKEELQGPLHALAIDASSPEISL